MPEMLYSNQLIRSQVPVHQPRHCDLLRRSSNDSGPPNGSLLFCTLSSVGVVVCKAPSTPTTFEFVKATFDIVAKTGSTVAGFGNSVAGMFILFRVCRKDEISFDNVAKLATLLPKTATTSKQHSTLSKESFDL